MNKLLPSGRWESHPWTRSGMVRHCPLWILNLLSNKEISEYTERPNGELAHRDELWENIKRVGMHEPLLITISSKKKKIRLESGGNRLVKANQEGLTHLPVAVQVIDRGWLSSNLHAYDATELVYWDRVRPCMFPMQVDPIDTLNFNGFKRIAPLNTELRDFVI